MTFPIEPMSERDRVFLRRAYQRALEGSDDPQTKNGAIIIPENDAFVPGGCNRFPEGIAATPERLERPAKYDYIVHAEADAILNAAKHGISTNGATMYAPWVPCMGCARTIIASGIKSVIAHHEMHERGNVRWDEEIKRAVALLQEAGVAYKRVSGVVGRVRGMFDGVEWNP